MSIVDDIAELAEEIRGSGKGIRVEFEPLPSGVAYLDVVARGRLFVMAYFPREGGIGVDEVSDDDEIGSGYRRWFRDFSSAKQELLAMVNESIHGRQGG